MDLVRSFKKDVVENKSLVIVAAVLCLFLRIGVYFSIDDLPSYVGGGYLWNLMLSDIFTNKLFSALGSLICTCIIVFYTAQLNTEHALIRSRSYLVPALMMLLFSCHPVFVFLTPQYLGVLAVLVSTMILLSTYQDKQSSGRAFSIGFVLAVGSLFAFHTLMYLLVFIIGLRMMRCLSFKRIVAMIMGAVSVYWLTFFCFLVQNDIDAFVAPFLQLHPAFYSDLRFTDWFDLGIIAVIILVILIVFLNYQTNSFHDKIRIRANLLFLNILLILSLASFLLVIYDPLLNVYVMLFSSSILLAHFFSLTNENWKVYFFCFFLVLCGLIYIYCI